MTSWPCVVVAVVDLPGMSTVRVAQLSMAAKRERRKDKEQEKGISEEQSKTKSQNFCLEMKFDFNASGCKRSPVTTSEEDV